MEAREMAIWIKRHGLRLIYGADSSHARFDIRLRLILPPTLGLYLDFFLFFSYFSSWFL